MKRLKNILTLLFISLIIASCSDNGEPTPYVYSKLFSGETSKTWKFKSIAFKNVGDEDWTLSQACWRDETYTFFRDQERKLEIKSGNSLCDPDEEPLDITDTWAFSNANASLYFIFPLLSDFALPYTVKEIDKKEMVLEIYFNDAGTQSYQMIFEVVSEN
jgi:hypothetical protein